VVLVLVVAVGALAVVAATDPARLVRVRVRAVRLLVGAAVIQVTTSTLMPGLGVARAVALVLTTLLVGLFLAGNAKLPGVPLIALGLLLNVVVITANGAMPVSVTAANHAGLTRADLRLDRDAMRVPASGDTRLRSLGDVVPVALPRWPQVVSPGDVLVAAGVGLLLVTAGLRRGPGSPMRRRGSQRPRPSGQTPSRAVRSTVLESVSTTKGSYS
jgi:hypothetical protein